jgi:hypothetical protein
VQRWVLAGLRKRQFFSLAELNTAMTGRPHPEQGLRSCLGLIRLGKKYGLERVEAASRRAVGLKAHSYAAPLTSASPCWWTITGTGARTRPCCGV